MSGADSAQWDVPALPAWPAAAKLVARWLDRRERIDTLLDSLRGLFGGDGGSSSVWRSVAVVFGLWLVFSTFLKRAPPPAP